MKFKRIQPYRDVFIAELHSEDVRSDGGPLIVFDGVGIHIAYYIVDDFGEVLHPIQGYFVSPQIAMGAADILLDTPKKFGPKVSALIRAEKDFHKEF